MSRLADLQHLPGMSPGCFLTLYQSQIQAQHTLASTGRKHGCRAPAEAKTRSLIWTPARRSRSLDRTQQHRQKSHPNLSCSPVPSLQDQPFPPGLSVWEGTATKPGCSTREGGSLITSLARRASRTCRRSPGWDQSHNNSDPFTPPFMWFMRLVSCSGCTKPRCAALLTLISHLHPSLTPVQKAVALFHMDFLTLFCHKGLKTNCCILLLIQSTTELQDKAWQIQGFTLRCLVWQIHSKSA